MSDKIHQIIRSQWPRRNSVNADVRRQARNLIRAHIEWLRRLRSPGQRLA